MWDSRVLWVGVGYQRDSSHQIEAAIQQVCCSWQITETAIAGIATIDHKAADLHLAQLCSQRNWACCFFPAYQLRQAGVPTPSGKVAAEVGTSSVAEAAALLAASPDSVLLVPKQIIRQPEQPGSVTVAIAQSIAQSRSDSLSG